MADNIDRGPWTFFCDEAGNTGANYLDPDQPFAVSAGWFVSPSNVLTYCDTIKRLWPSANGVFKKSNRVLKTERGRETAIKALSALCEVATPLFIINEKRWTLLTEVFELLCDSDWNTRTLSWDAYDHVRRADVCWQLFDALPEGMFESFLSAYRKDVDVNRFSELAQSLSFYLNQLGFRDDAWAIRGFDARLCWKEGRPEWWGASNVRTFFALVNQLVEGLAATQRVVYNVLHHRCSAHGSAMAHLASSTGGSVLVPQSNDSTIRIGLSHIVDFSLTPSEGNDPCEVVGADILASSLFRLARNRETLSDVSFSDRVLAKVLERNEDGGRFLMSRAVGESLMAFMS